MFWVFWREFISVLDFCKFIFEKCFEKFLAKHVALSWSLKNVSLLQTNVGTCCLFVFKRLLKNLNFDFWFFKILFSLFFRYLWVSQLIFNVISPIFWEICGSLLKLDSHNFRGFFVWYVILNNLLEKLEVYLYLSN